LNAAKKDEPKSNKQEKKTGLDNLKQVRQGVGKYLNASLL
jgi:hypothetical protein